MTVATYDFKEQKQVGEESERWLDAYFERWYEIAPATTEQQAQGIDRIFTRPDTSTEYTVEYKTDWTAGKTGNAFVETISVDIRYVAGWAYASCADMLIYYVPRKSIYVIAFHDLRLQLAQWCRLYPRRSIPNRGYNSRGLLVPLTEFGKIARQVIAA